MGSDKWHINENSNYMYYKMLVRNFLSKKNQAVIWKQRYDFYKSSELRNIFFKSSINAVVSVDEMHSYKELLAQMHLTWFSFLQKKGYI